MKNKMLPVLLIIIAAALNGYAQKIDANKILEKVKSNFSTVKDYRVNVKVKVNVDFLKVPETEAELLWKQPGKTKINSEGFAMLPKQTMYYSPQQLFSGNFTSILEREESIDNHPCYVIKVVPMGETSEVLLSTLWIDKTTSLVYKVESMMRNSGASTIQLSYDENFARQYPLPSKIVFSFDVSKANMPRMMNNRNEDENKRKRGKFSKGNVEIVYSNYKVNVGLDNSLFTDKKK